MGDNIYLSDCLSQANGQWLRTVLANKVFIVQSGYTLLQCIDVFLDFRVFLRTLTLTCQLTELDVQNGMNFAPCLVIQESQLSDCFSTVSQLFLTQEL